MMNVAFHSETCLPYFFLRNSPRKPTRKRNSGKVLVLLFQSALALFLLVFVCTTGRIYATLSHEAQAKRYKAVKIRREARQDTKKAAKSPDQQKYLDVKSSEQLGHDNDSVAYHLRDGPWVLEKNARPQQRGIAAANKKDWSIPHVSAEENKDTPSFCGDKLEFDPFAKNTITGRTLERGRGTKTFFRVARPDLIDRVSEAVNVIDESGDLDTNSFCEVFGSCNTTDKLQSRHSKRYLACSEQDRWIHASDTLVGASQNPLPSSLSEQGDDNVFCEITKYAADMVSNLIFEFNELTNKHCVVQELFINQQRYGGITKRHVHVDDTYGGLFYLDTPPGTKLCFSNSEYSVEKQFWWKFAPELTENLYPYAPGKKGKMYPGYFEPRRGDIMFFPVGWLYHWVPKIIMPSNEKRTSVVFNMICI